MWSGKFLKKHNLKKPLKSVPNFLNQNVFHDPLEVYSNIALPALKIQSHQESRHLWPMSEKEEIKLTGIFTSQAEQPVKKQTSSLRDLTVISFDCFFLKGVAKLNGALGQY